MKEMMWKTIQNSMMRLLQVSLLTAAIVALFFTSCTNVDYGLGSELLPDSYDMTLSRDTLRVNAKTMYVDSLYSDVWTYSLLGSYVDVVWGGTTASTLYQILPVSGYFSSYDTLWGTDPVVDSVRLVLSIDSEVGDTLSEHIIDIYEVTGLPTCYDSAYYSNFDPTPYINSTPIASFNLSSDSSSYTMPEILIEKYLDTNEMAYYNDSLFLLKYPGLYFKTRESVSEKGLLSTINNSYSSINVYYHNKNEDPDTTIMAFNFGGSYSTRNKVITMIQNDFSLGDMSVGVNQSYIGIDVENPPITYVRSFAGLKTYVEVLESELDRIRANAESLGYSRIAVNNATLMLPIYLPSGGTYDNAPEQLGMYYTYEVGEGTHDYWYGIDTDTYSFNGLISRSLGRYTMDISSYIQRRFTYDEDVEGEEWVDIAPAFGYEATNVGVKLVGSADEDTPMEIHLTYTMMK